MIPIKKGKRYVGTQVYLIYIYKGSTNPYPALINYLQALYISNLLCHTGRYLLTCTYYGQRPHIKYLLHLSTLTNHNSGEVYIFVHNYEIIWKYSKTAIVDYWARVELRLNTSRFETRPVACTRTYIKSCKYIFTHF